MMVVMVVFSASAAAIALPPSGPSLLELRLQKKEREGKGGRCKRPLNLESTHNNLDRSKDSKQKPRCGAVSHVLEGGDALVPLQTRCHRLAALLSKLAIRQPVVKEERKEKQK